MNTTANTPAPTTCDCCGKEDLKATVRVRVMGNTRYYGAGCARRLECVKIAVMSALCGAYYYERQAARMASYGRKYADDFAALYAYEIARRG